MTYEPGTDTVTTEDNLTSEEQESLAVGEDLQAKQEGLLAGKYKNAEELEKPMQNSKKSLESKALKLARKLGTNSEMDPKKKLKRKKKLSKILQQLP